MGMMRLSEGHEALLTWAPDSALDSIGSADELLPVAHPWGSLGVAKTPRFEITRSRSVILLDVSVRWDWEGFKLFKENQFALAFLQVIRADGPLPGGFVHRQLFASVCLAKMQRASLMSRSDFGLGTIEIEFWRERALDPVEFRAREMSLA